jgi:hypothetical protein
VEKGSDAEGDLDFAVEGFIVADEDVFIAEGRNPSVHTEDDAA